MSDENQYYNYVFKESLRDITFFSDNCVDLRLRNYQVQVARAIIDSVIHRKGLTFVVIFPRQSGKNEAQAHVETYLLTMFSLKQLEIVKVSPTWKPQALNAMRRLERTLKRNTATRQGWSKRSGYIYQFGNAMVHFLSGDPTSNIVGATASLLLECDEAQDVTISKWDKEILPMAASTDATRVFWGTTWTSQTLLARELRLARLAQQADGVQRAWVLTADDVAAEVPSYRKFVTQQVTRMGRNNPLVRTQYYSEEIDNQTGMFPLDRRMLVFGAHDRQSLPTPGEAYAFTIDVAGQDEAATTDLEQLANPARDSTVLTIFQVCAPQAIDPLPKPTYKVVYRRAWQGVKHSTLYGALLGLVETWSPFKVIIDATGVGAGLANFLLDRLGSRLVPFEFTQKSKSGLGWDFISTIETGRYKEYNPMDAEMLRQMEYCQYEIMDGPGKLMRWGVPDGCREVASGDLVHDDHLLSAALISQLDHEVWGVTASKVITQVDILEGMKF